MKQLIQRLERRAVSEVCYWICEHLEQHTWRRTTGTRFAAGNAIAVSWVLNWKRALDEDEGKLPAGMASVLDTFSPEEWREVMSNASSSESFLGAIQRPEWAHLRRKPIN